MSWLLGTVKPYFDYWVALAGTVLSGAKGLTHWKGLIFLLVPAIPLGVALLKANWGWFDWIPLGLLLGVWIFVMPVHREQEQRLLHDASLKRLADIERRHTERFHFGFVTTIDAVDCTQVAELTPSLRVLIEIKNFFVSDIDVKEFKFLSARFSYPKASTSESLGVTNSCHGVPVPWFDRRNVPAVFNINKDVKEKLRLASDAHGDVVYEFQVEWKLVVNGAESPFISNLTFKAAPEVPPERAQRAGTMGL